MHTDDVAVSQEDNSIILNCTYHKDSMEKISDRDIRWQKRIEGEFQDLAVFSPPGGLEPFLKSEKKPLYKNRTELIAPNISLVAVMVIRNPVCSDEGIYRCSIDYYSGTSENSQTSRSVVEFNGNFYVYIFSCENKLTWMKYKQKEIGTNLQRTATTNNCLFY